MAVIVFLFSSCSGGNHAKKVAKKLVQEECACLESAKISISPALTNLFKQMETSSSNVDLFLKAVSQLSLEEKEEIIQLSNTVYEADGAVGRCLDKAWDNVDISDAENSRFNMAMNEAINDKNNCSTASFLDSKAIIYARLAIEYSNNIDKECGCFTNSGISLNALNPTVQSVLDEAANGIMFFTDVPGYGKLSIKDKAQLNELSDEIYDTTSMLGSCLAKLRKEKTGMIRDVRFALSGDHIQLSVGEFDLNHGDMLKKIRKNRTDCRFIDYYHYALTKFYY